MIEPSPDTEAAGPGLQRENSGKVRGRPFVKGQSGNPNGRRKGTVSPTAALRRILSRTDAERIARTVIDAAADGDLQATKLLFDRIDGASSSPMAVALAHSDVAHKSKPPFDYAGFEKVWREYGLHSPDNAEALPDKRDGESHPRG